VRRQSQVQRPFTKATPMKLCPYCSGEMEDAAVVCQHCRRDWKTGVSELPASQPSSPPEGSTPSPYMWPWGFLAIILFSIMLAANCYFMQRVMH
jgi:hypothetical protein